jgi:predicted MPP superfamily phosphohydrolase
MDLFQASWIILLFVGAVFGHAALTIRCHNWWYGSGLGKGMIDVLQLIHGLIMLAGPVLFWIAGPDLRSLFLSSTPSLPDRLLAGYVAACWVAGFVVVPVVTVARLCRRCSALESEEPTRIDLGRRLGRAAEGDGKLRLLSRLPFNEVFHVELIRKTLLLPRLPSEWDGLTILHVTDLHFCGTPSQAFYAEALELCGQWQPDLVALTGDYVDSVAHHSWLTPLLGPLNAREAKLAILGNHDHWYEPEQVRDRLQEMGYHTPRNGWETIQVRGLPMTVIGHEGPWVRPAPDLSDCPADVFRLCLSHTPDNISWAKRHAIDLMLSGHVHGGQVRLPVIGSLLLPSQFGRRYDCGVFLEGPTVLHVSRGLGSKDPMRFLCPPEATLLILRRAPC